MILQRHYHFIALAGTLFLSLMWPAAQAQQTIFNVPSADVTPKNNLYLEQESQFRFLQPSPYWVGTHYAAIGIGHNTEIDTTLYNLSNPHSDNISLGIGYKNVLPLLPQAHPDREFKLTSGFQAIPSFEGRGLGEWGYAHFSGRVPGLKTRLTAGVSEGTRQLFGRNTVHFIGGVEQPVTKNFSVISDWYSGTHGLGFWTTGIAYALPRAFTIFVGYQVPNNASVGKQGFTFELAKILPLRR